MMTTLAALWLAMAAWAGSTGADLSTLPSVSVHYDVTFDLGDLADKTCNFTGVCDCRAAYDGTGQVVGVDGDRVTFKGTWTLTEGSCHDTFLFWNAGKDGTSYHTVRFSKDRTQIVEWVAHADVEKKDRLTSDIKAGQQVWLADMTAGWDPSTRTATHAESETQQASGLAIASTHNLTLTFGE